MQNILVILNERAGSLAGRNAGEVREMAKRTLGAGQREVDVVLAHGKEMVRAIRKGAKGNYDTLIVGGGDGSANCAAEALSESGKTLGVLPLGTMNLFARDLEMPLEPQEAFAAIASGRTKEIDLARLNGKIFHTLSGIGFFSQMARAREEVRGLPGRIVQVSTAAFRALSRSGSSAVTVSIDGKVREIETYALLVTVNRIAEGGWRREAMDGGTLEVHFAADEGALARLKAGADLLSGNWRDNPGIESYAASRVRIESARRRTWVATDGELSRKYMPLEYVVVPRAINVLVPNAGEVQAASRGSGG